MNTELIAFDAIHLLGESATHPMARLLVRLPLSRLLAGPGPQRTRKGQAGAVKPLKRQQPRSRCFAVDTRSDAPSGAFNSGF